MSEALYDHDVVQTMIALAREEAETNPRPRERCGVVVKAGNKAKVIECDNVHTSPEHRFRIAPEEWAYLNMDHEILSIWHTHPNGTAAPTQADLVELEIHGVPWHIVSWPEGGHSYTMPTGYKAPYEGRVSIHGVLDCYSLVKDWYEREMGIMMPAVYRPDDWWAKGMDLYRDHLAQSGFVSMPHDFRNVKRGDGFLMQIGSRVPNHAAVYVGDGKILHHPLGQLSRVMPFGGFWLKNTTHFLRHESQL